MQEKAERNELPPPAPPMTSPGPSQGGETKLAKKLVITHFVIMHYELCIMH